MESNPGRAAVVFRWLLVLPGAIAAYLIVETLIIWSNMREIRFVFVLRDPPSWMGTAVYLLNSYFPPLAYVWFGAEIAPAHKFATAVGLAALHAGTLLTVFIALLSLGGTMEHWYEYLMMPLGLAGTVTGCIVIWKQARTG